MTTAGAFSFTTAHGMIDRVLGNTTNFGPLTFPAVAASLAQFLTFVLDITDLPYGSHAFPMKASYFAGRQLDEYRIAFLGHKLGRRAGTADQLAAFADLHFDIVNDGTKRHITHGHAIARFDIHRFAGLDGIADLDTDRREDISFFAVRIEKQSDIGTAVGIVFDRGYLGRDIDLVPLEIDQPVFAFVTTAHMPGGNPPVIVAAAAFGQRSEQTPFRAFLGKLRIHDADVVASSW